MKSKIYYLYTMKVNTKTQTRHRQN